jgi:hypothetical protein
MSELIRIDAEIAAVIADAESAAEQGAIDACPHPADSKLGHIWAGAYFRKSNELYLAAMAA